MPGRCEPPLSRLDVLLAHPFLTAMQESREAPPPAARPDILSPHAAGSWGPKARRASARLPQTYAALRHGVASFLSPGPEEQSDDAFKSVLMFSLAGLALSLYLAAQIHMAGADEGLAGILMLPS